GEIRAVDHLEKASHAEPELCAPSVPLTNPAARLGFCVSVLPIQFRQGSPYLPAQGLWLDAREPQIERVFVSHAHSDHIAEHKEIILSAPTAKLMQVRLPGTRQEHVLDFGETRRFVHHNGCFDVTLFPAGHI